MQITALSPDKASPQAAGTGTGTVRWTVIATGGVGSYTYTFWNTDGQTEKGEQKGPLPTWDWSPREPGTYQVKVDVRDASGKTARSGWSPEYVVAPKLVLSSLSPDNVSPQMAWGAKIRWKCEAAGGVGERTFEFRVSDGKGERVVQGGASSMLDWTPGEPGTYRVKAVVRDAIGNTAESPWSGGFEMASRLLISSLAPDKESPQPAEAATVRWKAAATGGVGERVYSFWISDGKEEAGEQKGPLPTWDWTPREPGKYRVKVVARDKIGNTADSGWSPEFRIELVAGKKSLIAVMPAQNLTGMALPVKEFRGSFVDAMKSKGLMVLGEEALENFMEKHRVRYIGGLNPELGEAFLGDEGVAAVLFLSMELYDDTVPPKTALVARLVSTGKKTAVLWMDSAAMAGNDAPGFLLLGLINDPRVLWGKAKDRVVNSLTAYLSGKTTRVVRKAEKKFRPKSFLGTPPKPPDGKETFSVAVLPFRNDSTRRNAGEILALLFVKELSKREDIDVVEPGEVIQTLLRSRTIMEGGLSLPQADILKAALNVDLVLTGIVMEYQDYIGGWGFPKVEFSTRVFDMKTRQIVWSSSSYNQGDDGVFFFNLGKVNTAQGMASGMVRSVVEGMDALMGGVAGQMAGAAPPVSR